MAKESRRDVAPSRRSGESSRPERASAGSDTSSRRSRRDEEPPSDRKKAEKAGDTRRSKRVEEPLAETRSSGRTSKSSRREEIEDAPAPPKRSSRRAAESEEAPRTSKRRASESDDAIAATRSSKRRAAHDDGGGKGIRESSRRARGEARRDEDEDGEATPAEGSSKLLLIVVGVLVLGGLGGAGWYFTRPPDLPALLANLDKFKSPGEDYADRAKQNTTVKGLVAFGSAAIPGCQAVLDDPGRKNDARVGAALALGLLKADAAIPSLVRAIEVEAIAEMVAIALVDVGDNAISALVAAAREAKGPHALRLIAAIVRHKSPTLVPKALAELGGAHPETATRVKAVESLAALKTMDCALALARLLLTDSAEVRSAAERGLDSQQDNQLVLAAGKLMEGQVAAERRLAMMLVQGVGVGAKDLVEQGLSDSDLSVAIAAAPGVGTVIAGTREQTDDDKRDTERRRSSLAERVKSLCSDATTDEDLLLLGKAAALGKLTSLDQHFRGWLATGTSGQKIAAIEALCGFSDGQIAGEFIGLAADPDAKVAETASRSLFKIFQRGRKDWRDFHYGADKAPTSPSAWKTWWETQSWIFEQRKLYEEEKAEGTRLLQIRTFKSMKQAYDIFFVAQGRIIEIGEKKIAGGDPMGEMTPLIQELAGLIEMSMKNRPTE